MIPIGIDLGTSNSLIAHINAVGVPALFPDRYDSNAFQTPSVVHVAGGSCLVGLPAEDVLEDDPAAQVARFAKLRLATGEPAFVDEQSRAWSAEAASALVLRKLLQDAAAFAHDAIGSTVITVPAQFGDAERRATREAAMLAGIQNIKLLEEPIAAATYYGLSSIASEQTFFVYDLGGGTFDATLLHASKEGLFVLASEGCSRVGGKAFDEALMSHIAEDYQRQHGFDPCADAVAEMQLRRLSEELKIRLGRPGTGQVRRTLLLAGHTHELYLNRSQLDKIVGALVQETIEVSNRCLQSAGLGWSAVDKILLVGGASLMPLVGEQVRKVSGKPGVDIVSQQPHQAVAFGAALVADLWSNEAADQDGGLVQRIANHAVGLRVWNSRANAAEVQVLIKRNAPLPASATSTFYTTRPDQSRMVFEVVQTKGEAETEQSLGHFAFGPIETPRKNYPIELQLEYDIDGIVHVRARDAQSGREISRVMEEGSEGLLPDHSAQRDLVLGMRINE